MTLGIFPPPSVAGVAGADGTDAPVPTGTGYVHITAGVTDNAAVALHFQLEILIGDGINAITTGLYPTGVIQCPRDGTVTGWTILSCDAATPTTGAIVIDLWKDTYAHFPPVVGDSMIPSGTKPTISASANSATFSSLTGWTTTLTAGDVIFPNVDSVTSFKAVKLIVTYTSTTA